MPLIPCHHHGTMTRRNVYVCGAPEVLAGKVKEQGPCLSEAELGG